MITISLDKFKKINSTIERITYEEKDVDVSKRIKVTFEKKCIYIKRGFGPLESYFFGAQSFYTSIDMPTTDIISSTGKSTRMSRVSKTLKLSVEGTTILTFNYDDVSELFAFEKSPNKQLFDIMIKNFHNIKSPNIKNLLEFTLIVFTTPTEQYDEYPDEQKLIFDSARNIIELFANTKIYTNKSLNFNNSKFETYKKNQISDFDQILKLLGTEDFNKTFKLLRLMNDKIFNNLNNLFGSSVPYVERMFHQESLELLSGMYKIQLPTRMRLRSVIKYASSNPQYGQLIDLIVPTSIHNIYNMIDNLGTINSEYLNLLKQLIRSIGRDEDKIVSLFNNKAVLNISRFKNRTNPNLLHLKFLESISDELGTSRIDNLIEYRKNNLAITLVKKMSTPLAKNESTYLKTIIESLRTSSLQSLLKLYENPPFKNYTRKVIQKSYQNNEISYLNNLLSMSSTQLSTHIKLYESEELKSYLTHKSRFPTAKTTSYVKSLMRDISTPDLSKYVNLISTREMTNLIECLLSKTLTTIESDFVKSIMLRCSKSDFRTYTEIVTSSTVQILIEKVKSKQITTTDIQFIDEYIKLIGNTSKSKVMKMLLSKLSDRRIKSSPEDLLKFITMFGSEEFNNLLSLYSNSKSFTGRIKNICI